MAKEFKIDSLSQGKHVSYDAVGQINRWSAEGWEIMSITVDKSEYVKSDSNHGRGGHWSRELTIVRCRGVVAPLEADPNRDP